MGPTTTESRKPTASLQPPEGSIHLAARRGEEDGVGGRPHNRRRLRIGDQHQDRHDDRGAATRHRTSGGA